MFFGSPEHLTFLRYEVLSPHQRNVIWWLASWDSNKNTLYEAEVWIFFFRTKHSLNAVSMDSAIGLLRLALADGVQVKEVMFNRYRR